jgi:N-acetylglucosamine malate deacetylase 1
MENKSMKKIPYQKVLLLSAHTDDFEFGCGATVNRLIRQGSEIYSAVFSICEESVPKGFEKDVLLNEMYNSIAQFGIKKENVRVFKFPVRKFPEFRQEILEEMVKIQKEIQPDLIFTSSRHDIHQDHQVICNESIRAFRYQTILGYELPWNNLSFTNNALIEVEKIDLDVKAAAISKYKSQNFRHYSKKAFFHLHAQLRGAQNKTKYAEAFEVIKVSL